MNIKNPEGVLYLNCESGKRLPFKSGFKEVTILDPLQVYEAFMWAQTKPEYHTIIVDSVTYLLDMYETRYVHNASDGQKAWGEFAQYFKRLMQEFVAGAKQKVIFTAHTMDSLNTSEHVLETKVPVKGALKNNGLESYFSVVIGTKRPPMKVLNEFDSPLLTYTEQETISGVKHVFQTQITRDTAGERIRGPIGMWNPNETFINNDIQLVLDRLDDYYKQ